MTAYDRRSFAGGATATTLASGIDASTLTVSIAAATGWPTGSGGDFGIIIDRGTASEEKLLVDTRSSTTLTITSGGRGVDGSSGVTHTSGATVEVCLLARDLDEANAHIADTSLDHHTQYLTTARHDIEGRHSFGSALGTPSAAADIGTAAATGSGDDPAREDHVHKIGTGAINVAGMFAAGVVDAAAIGANAIGTSELADNAVDTNAIADDAVTAAKIADGAIDAAAKFGAGVVDAAAIATNAVTATELADNAVDTASIAALAVTLAKLASEAGTDYVPTLTNVTLGSGGTKYGRSFKMGRMVVGVVGFTLGTGGNVTSTISVSLPYASAAGTGVDYVGAARGVDSSTSNGAGGMGVIIAGEQVLKNFVTVGSSNWDEDTPWNWDDGDTFRGFFFYEAAT